MRESYYIAGAVIVALILAKRAQAAANAVPQARVGELSEGIIMDGSNWTTNLWDRFAHAGDLQDTTARNVSGTSSADFSGTVLAGTGISAGWDGSLA